jgi:putative hydrolase of the HAD superfamily
MRKILFDVDGVLVHGYHARPELRKFWDEKIAEDFGIDRERFRKEFIFGPFVREVIVGKKTLAEALSVSLPALGYNGDPQIFIDYWLRKDSNLNLPLLEKIKILKRSGQVKLFIATNQEHNRASYLMENLGFNEYFEDIFYSARIGHLKPSEEYFRYVNEALNCEKNDIPLLFDDTPSVVAEARNFGWQAVEFIDTASLHESDFIDAILRESV